jgi:hypothetical protein
MSKKLIIENLFKEAAQIVLASQLDVRLEQSKLTDEQKQRVRDLDKRIVSKNKAKYAAFLIKFYTEPDVIELINEFDRMFQRLEKKDINQYNVEDLRKILQLAGKKKTETQIKTEGAKKVYENAKVSVYHILNREASCLYGAGTKWCTTASEQQNMFRYYHAGHNLYYILSKYRQKEDPLYKIAIIVDDKGKKTVYNSLDDVIDIAAVKTEGVPI